MKIHEILGKWYFNYFQSCFKKVQLIIHQVATCVSIQVSNQIKVSSVSAPELIGRMESASQKVFRFFSENKFQVTLHWWKITTSEPSVPPDC